MGFSAKQVQALRRQPNRSHIRTREAHGRELTYLEGWYVISEANRIFGFDGWSRETIESKCVLARENRGTYLAVYTARVRLTVQADGATIIREGHGTGEGRGHVPGRGARHRPQGRGDRCHQTGAGHLRQTVRSRALSRRQGGSIPKAPARTAPGIPRRTRCRHARDPMPADARLGGLHPDDTTPIPRPSRYYGRRQDLVTRDRAHGRRELDVRPSVGSSIIVPVSPTLVPGPIDKSLLTIAEPKRLRDKAHLKFVASQPCLICGRQPCDPHHLRFAQPRALGLKVSDEFTVPLCRGHHQQLHQAGNEVTWWQTLKIDALPIARELWEQTHPKSAAEDARPPDEIAAKTVTEN